MSKTTTTPTPTPTPTPGPRGITFDAARAQYVHRFTMDYIPAWAAEPFPPVVGEVYQERYYAPQYQSDREWYERTLFPGDAGYPSWQGDGACYSTNQTWPLGKELRAPYQKGTTARRDRGTR
jgi:hypothetical protein